MVTQLLPPNGKHQCVVISMLVSVSVLVYSCDFKELKSAPPFTKTMQCSCGRESNIYSHIISLAINLMNGTKKDPVLSFRNSAGFQLKMKDLSIENKAAMIDTNSGYLEFQLRMPTSSDSFVFECVIYGISTSSKVKCTYVPLKYIQESATHITTDSESLFNIATHSMTTEGARIDTSISMKYAQQPPHQHTIRRRSVTSPYQTTTPPRTESDKSSSKTSSYNEVDDLELTARIREEAESVEYTRPSPPTAHAHSTRSHAERLTAVPPEAVTIEQAARAQQPEYVEIENEVRPNGDDGYLVPAGQYASLNPATRSEEGHEYENLGSKPTEPSSTPGYSGLVKSTKREKHLYDRLKRETNQTVEAEEDEPAYAIALEQMPGPTFTKL